jgi:ATP-binding cassette, subfamily B (MDR/TAP), member 1
MASLAVGTCIQYLITCMSCLILALGRSFSLTLVIFSTTPLLILLQCISQSIALPLLESERSHTASAATLISRAISCITTVKAFNATAEVTKSLSDILSRMQSASIRLAVLWTVTEALSHFITMAMFVQGFWYGSKLIREGHVKVGDVTAVFSACLVATSSLRTCIPQLVILAKGKSSMASLLSVFPMSPTTTRSDIVPTVCEGELTIQNVTFSYPSRRTALVLHDVTISLPAGKMTFIVGDSGSGKSAIAHLLQHLYSPQSGTVHLDAQDISSLDAIWLRQNIACVPEQSILFDMTLHDNIAMGQEGTTREQVIQACTCAMIHEFVKDLPDGYETMLGVGGANLSRGQRQRLAIARALLWDPTVLILGMYFFLRRYFTFRG